MMIKFTNIPDRLRYPASVKGRLSTIHSSVITSVSETYTGGFKQRNKIVNLLNTLSYMIVNGDSFPDNWTPADPFSNITLVDDDMCRSTLKDLYLMDKNIEWDIQPVDAETTSPKNIDSAPSLFPKITVKADETVIAPTPKEDLYIRPPVIPQFDVNQIWAGGVVDGTRYAIYASQPTIPTKQNEISITTDVEKMTSADLRKLYPNRFIQTRSPSMYVELPGVPYHEQLGVILPIKGFTQKQLVDNLVKYPHIFRLGKIIDGTVSSFYTTIEIDGELHRVSDVWDTLPESKLIPHTADYIKEYVVRRYLLERDIKKMEHKYPMFGSLDPFLTLFTTPQDYVNLGYSNIEEMAIQCVKSRVEYKKTRNPVLRRLSNV